MTRLLQTHRRRPIRRSGELEAQAQLAQVTRERDEARAELAKIKGQKKP
jgi:hypothetical protein